MSFRSSIVTHLHRGASRKPLTPKGGNKNYYKGTGTGAMGKFVNGSWAYHVDSSRVRQFIVPDLTGFKLKAYVSWAVPQSKYVITKQAFLDSVKPATQPTTTSPPS